MEKLIARCKEEYAQLDAQLRDPAIARDAAALATLGKRHAELANIIAKIERREAITKQMAQNAELLASEDADMVALATEENAALAAEREALTRELERLLIPRDPADARDVILEIRAGAGGDESALFAAELLRMYLRYAESHGWRAEILTTHRTPIGGVKEAIVAIAAGSGTPDVYGHLKYESGVHRVQRVPETEKQGRIHTSTATVAVLPQMEEVDVHIDPKDLRIDTFASSGPGGQSVNTTMSAVRITHLPTGIVVSCQDEKSQHKNKARALQVLRARIKQREEERRAQEIGDARRAQIGTGDRSEKIRTYNFPQDRITDHRLKRNWSNIPDVLGGNLNPIISALQEEDARRRVANAH